MSIGLYTRFSLGNETDLTTPTSTQQYALGAIITVQDSTKTRIKRYMYIKASGALTQYQAYVINYSATSGAEVIAVAPTDAFLAPGEMLAVPQIAFTDTYYGFVLIEGDGKVLKTAETYAVGDFLAWDLTTSTSALIVDGSTGATTRTVDSFAISKTAGTGAAAIDVALLGNRAVLLKS